MKIGILGFGNVARATVEVLQRNAVEITRRTGREIEIVAIGTRTPAKAVGVVSGNCTVTADLTEVVGHQNIDVIVELMGGVDAAHRAILAAIDSGKHVVTANKALLAIHGDSIFKRARERGVIVAFEAAVAVAIPIIKILREACAANIVQSVRGIVNGTSNFVLTAMREEGVSYELALANAQSLGFAEADPSFDVNGNDAAHKLSILATLAFGIPLNLDTVQMQGISQVKIEDVRFAESLGYRIKLLASATRTAAGLDLRVEPTLVSHSQLLAQVNGAMNAIEVIGDSAGPTFHYGAGAGGIATASAVIADLVDIARILGAAPAHQLSPYGFQPSAIAQMPYAPPGQVSNSYYLRIQLKDELGALASLTATLAQNGLSVDVMRQQLPAMGQTTILIVTHDAPRWQILAAIAGLQIIASVCAEIVCYVVA